MDKTSGAVSNATLVERMGTMCTALGAQVLRPFDDLGFSIAAKLVKKVFPSERAVMLRFADDRFFRFPYGDGYWGLLLEQGRHYEPEVEALLMECRDIDYAFIDCGANFGYWSVQVSSSAFGSHKAVAIELDADNFRVLQENAEANGGRFDCLNRAVSSVSGETVEIYGGKHEARSIVAQDGESGRGSVETVTIDELVANGHVSKAGPVILKLDVEGVEVEALKGAQALLQRDLLVVYEEHGSDATHSVSRHLLEDLGMRIFGHDTNGFFELGSIDKLDAIKTNPRWGYDFFATRTDVWLERLDALANDRGDAQAASSQAA
ncbi:FkbM family methyltransferase [Roseibium sp.]|uniref:FkbM family methyltransferase n=1 Tax=Roseibium sp. TaxID=1936156 RepID=UPI003A97010F